MTSCYSDTGADPNRLQCYQKLLEKLGADARNVGGDAKTDQSAAAVSDPPQIDVGAWSQAYARRSFRLGMSFTEFKRTKHPDDPSAFIVCSDQDRNLAHPEVHVSREHRSIGLIKCSYYYKMRSIAQPFVKELALGSTSGKTLFYLLKTEETRELVLFWITSETESSSFERVFDSLVIALGKPVSVTNPEWRNRAGTVLRNTVASWQNAVSRVQITRLGRDSTKLELEHTLTPVFDVFTERLQQLSAEDAKRL